MQSLITVAGKGVRIQGSLLRIARLDGEKYEFPEDPVSVLNGLRKCGTRIDVFTFLQKLPEDKPKFSFPLEWDNLAVLPVSTFDNWWNHQIRSFPRNRARQAEKRGVVIREVPFDDVLLQGICDVYNECPVRQGKPFQHYGMTLERAREYAGTFPGRSAFIGAFLGSQMIGFIKLVTDETATQACVVHIVSMVGHKEKAPTNALIAHAVRVCAERKIQFLVYENFAYGKKQSDGLSNFKEVNGFQRVNVPRYYVPLNPWGWLGFRMGFHHRLIDRVPESVGARLRSFRRAWYGRKFQQVTEA